MSLILTMQFMSWKSFFTLTDLMASPAVPAKLVAREMRLNQERLKKEGYVLHSHPTFGLFASMLCKSLLTAIGIAPMPTVEESEVLRAVGAAAPLTAYCGC